MLDTVILTIEGGSVQTIKDSRVPGWNLHSQSNAFSKFTKNQTSLQKRDRVYRPRVTGIKRGKSRVIRLEFSVPKLLYGNNIDEVTDSDFPLVTKLLRERLADLGVIVSEKTLREAKVSGFHPSKNIILDEGHTVSEVLQELSKVNLTQKMELTKQTFYNGEALQFWSKSHSMTIYDKKRDYGKSKGGATDKDKHVTTQSFLDALYLLPEILRIEVRLAETRKMNQVLDRIGHATNPNFVAIFNSMLCQKIVEDYWKNLVADDNRFLFSAVSAPQNFLKLVRRYFPDIKQKQALYLVGLLQAAKDEGGITGLRNTLNLDKRSWYRLVEDLRSLDFLTEHEHEWINTIEAQISTFSPIQLSELCVKYCKV